MWKMGIEEDPEEKGRFGSVESGNNAEEKESFRKFEQKKKDLEIPNEPAPEVSNYTEWLFGPLGDLGRALRRTVGSKKGVSTRSGK